MGLKEVLSKMKLVEMEPEESVALPPPAGKPLQPGPPADIRDLLGTLPEPPAIDESKLPGAQGAEGDADVSVTGGTIRGGLAGA